MENVYTKGEVESIINATEQRVESEGVNNLDEVINQESKRVIEQNTSKSMMELNQSFRSELEGYFTSIDKVKSKYDKYLNSDRYSDIEKEKQKNLMEAELTAELSELQFNLNYKVDRFVNTFKANKDKINTATYQMQLSNLLKLMEFNPNLDVEFFDFIVEAKDSKLLNLLKDKYKTSTLITLSTTLDPKVMKSVANSKMNTIISYLKQGEKFVPRNTVYDILR